MSHSIEILLLLGLGLFGVWRSKETLALCAFAAAGLVALQMF